MDRRIESRARREGVGGEKMIAGTEHPDRPVLEPDFHFAAEDEDPLRLRRAMPLAAEADRAVAQLVSRRREHIRKHGLRVATGESNGFVAPVACAVALRV